MKALRRAAVVGGTAAVLLLGAAGPASAHPSKPVVTEPRGTQGQAGNTIVATVDPGHSTLTSASVSITRVGSSAPPVEVGATPGSTMRFGPVTMSLNGTYRATVTVNWEDPSLPLVRPETGTTRSDPHEFKVAAPPARPTGVAAAVDDASREVTVRWEKNGEADMRRYEVRRSHNGGGFTRAGFVDHPETSFVDASTAGAGGDYRYVVVAYRAGVDSAVGSQVASDPSPASTAKVPDPPPPPTTAPAAPETAVAGDQPTPATTAAGTAPTTAAGTSPGSIATPGRVDLGGFDNVRSRTPRPATPRTIPLPDPGFQGTLPFDVPAGGEGGEAVEGGDVGELAADTPDVRELGEEDASADRQRSLALFAGGLLATVLLMHVLWVKGEVKRVPLEAVAPEGPPPAGRNPRRAKPGKAAAGAAGAAKAARAKRPATAEWFVPDLGVDDGADRARATSGAERKAS